MRVPISQSIAVAFCLIAFARLSLSGQDTPQLDAGNGINLESVSLSGQTTLQVTFEESDGSFASFKVESAVNLSRAASAWTSLQGTEFEELGSNRFRATIPFNANDNRYFRIVGVGSANDLDGDGLTNDDEVNIHNTDPNDPDSDDDGFSDGVEVASNTDPNNAQDVPEFGQLPSVRFSLSKETIEEGNFTHRIDLESDQPVFGPISYTISTLSTSTEGGGGDLVLIGNTVDFAGGTTGSIEISLSDDAEIEDIEALIIDLSDAVDGNYRVGSVDQHILIIKDNDAFWTVQIIEGQSESSFRMLITEEGNVSSGKIVSASDNGAGVIPEGEWNLTITRTDTTFLAVSEPIPMENSLLLNTSMERRFTISVAPPVDTETPGVKFAYYLRSDRMVGTLLDEISNTNPNESYLDLESLKLIVLVRDAPSFVSIDGIENSEP